MPPKNKSILLIEDDGDIRQTVAEVLQQEGFEVECAGDGQEALQKLRDLPKPGLILLDIAMPIKDGFQFRREQEQDPRVADIPVVIMSADSHVQAKQMKTGARGYLKKPFEISTLIDTVKSLLAA